MLININRASIRGYEDIHLPLFKPSDKGRTEVAILPAPSTGCRYQKGGLCKTKHLHIALSVGLAPVVALLSQRVADIKKVVGRDEVTPLYTASN